MITRMNGETFDSMLPDLLASNSSPLGRELRDLLDGRPRLTTAEDCQASMRFGNAADGHPWPPTAITASPIIVASDMMERRFHSNARQKSRRDGPSGAPGRAN